MAINRVATRVKEGGHNIPTDVIERRYFRGLENLFKIYLPLCYKWAVYDNTTYISKIIARGKRDNQIEIINEDTWCIFKAKQNGN